MAPLNDIIRDTDNDVGRLRLGKEISRPRKKVDIKHDVHRSTCKEKLRDGAFTPWDLNKASAILLVTLMLTLQMLLYPPAILRLRIMKLS